MSDTAKPSDQGKGTSTDEKLAPDQLDEVSGGGSGWGKSNPAFDDESPKEE